MRTINLFQMDLIYTPVSDFFSKINIFSGTKSYRSGRIINIDFFTDNENKNL